MSSNFCGDHQENRVGQFHDKILAGFGLPQWMKIACPFCKRELPLRSIRSVSAKLNSRNLGDVTVEFYCVHCNKLDTLYFKSEVDSISEFSEMLVGDKTPKNVPLLEDDMYKANYNNVVEKMITSGESL